jgi:AhpD family alkylhydroperoxidase
MHIGRISPNQIASNGYKALSGVEIYLKGCGLPQSLIELVKMRSSQINGCAYCLDMHSKDALRAHERRSGCFCWMPGTRRLSTPRRSGPRWPGPTP